MGESELIAKYRAIRRMAIQGADYESEHKAFKGELRSRRWCIDKWWHPSAWLGVLYDGIRGLRPLDYPARNCLGRHNHRVCSVLWEQSLAGAEARCADGGGVFVQALYLSVKNGLVLFAGTRDARVNQAYVCLYGGSPEQPHIPRQRHLRRDTASVTDKRRAHFPRSARGEEQVQDQVAPSTVIAESAFALIRDLAAVRRDPVSAQRHFMP